MSKRREARDMALGALQKMPPVSLLQSPLEFIFADHFRQRVLCGVLDEMADSGFTDRKMTQAVLTFLTGEFGTHVIDEEEDLFPLLRRRAQPEDRIEDVLGDLSAEHATDKTDADEIIEVLQGVLESEEKTISLPKTAKLLRRFAANERRHLIVENAIIMPLAKARLSSDDLRNLGRRMAARRGVDFPEVKNAD